MSEPPSIDLNLEHAVETQVAAESDRTQPAEDILNALRQLNPQSLGLSLPIANNGAVELSTQTQEPAPPQSEWDQLRAHLREKPFDADSWLKLVDLAEDSGDIEKIKETYEALLEAYPNTPSVQIAYLSHFLDNPESHKDVEALFKRFLNRSPFVELWKLYLTYVRRLNTGPNARDAIRQSYEFAINRVGQDKDSTEIWVDYIQFLKSAETTTTWEEQQKMDTVRKAYHRAVQIPMENVKKLWEDYQEFENGLNKITAKKFLSDLQEGHMQARTVLTQLQEHLTVLFPPPPPSKSARPPIWLPRQPTFNAGDKALAGRWRMYLKWEESNPLEIEEKDKTSLIARIQSVYRKAVVRMRFFSEIWFMAYTWTNSIGRTDEAIALLKAGIEANPKSFVLNFAYAEALEIQENYEEVHAVFNKFVDILRADLDALESRLSSTNGPTSSNPALQSGAADVSPPTSQPGSQSQGSSVNSQSSDEKNPKSKELVDRRTEYGIAWIVYMRFAQRSEGLKSKRAVFAKARKDRWTPWEVYEAAALMEYHCGKNVEIASRIFERGLENFSDEIDFVMRYLGFLISVNDDNNARALFERVIGTFPPDRARPLWEMWARHEYQFGDLAAAQKIEKRMSEVYPHDPPMKRFAERHKYQGADAIAVRDLGFVVSRGGSNASAPSRSNGTLGRTDTQLSLPSQPTSQPQPVATSSKRGASPDHRRREESRTSDYGPPSKRQRPASPPRERDRDRWDGPPRRRHGTPPWEREHRDGPPRRFKEEKEEDKGVVLPPVLSWFVGMLPPAAAFDGPVFRTDDLMQVFRTAVIPSSSSATRARSPPPPPPPRAGGRPPPDYGPYPGPGRRGRY
ncbi:Suf-domain-containing protein [Obba rivulosa]|uniref:mRNA 3'-end-processing protein RNA14 n=1 Tax=Obba rivulosa TaxID=1052685 RepID=A0A8E2J4N8_9APHY|nr:Suf-domain-containing protein [Obba rivulosa]